MVTKVDKEGLTKIDGVGEAYADRILDEYDTIEEMIDDEVETASDKTGVPMGVMESVYESMGISVTGEIYEPGDEIDDDDTRKVDYIDNRWDYGIIHYENGDTERDDSKGLNKRRT